MKVRRDGWGWIHVDEHDPQRRWSFADPMMAGNSAIRSTLDYLLRVCPTTTDAKKKLADMRRAMELAHAEEKSEPKQAASAEGSQNPPAPSKGGKERA